MRWHLSRPEGYCDLGGDPTLVSPTDNDSNVNLQNFPIQFIILLLASPDVTIQPKYTANESSTAATAGSYDPQDDLEDLNSLSAAHIVFLGLVWIAVFMTVYSGLSWALFFYRRGFF